MDESTSAQGRSLIPARGIWIDDPAASLQKPAFWDTIAEHGLSTAAIMLEGVGNGFDPKYSLTDLSRAKTLAHERDIEIALTVWPEPNALYLDQLRTRIGGYISASGASALEFDAESNWLKPKVQGFKNLDVAGDKLVQIFDEIRMLRDVRMEVTTFTMHAENSGKADIAPHADRLLPQAYSVRNRAEGDVAWDGPHGPGAMQVLTLNRAKSIGPKLSVGLAAYDQVWPGKKGEDAMQAAWNMALMFEPQEVRFWSSKWVLGVKKNGYASRFLMSLPKR